MAERIEFLFVYFFYKLTPKNELFLIEIASFLAFLSL